MDEKVLFIAPGGLDWASARYRAHWIAKYARWADSTNAASIKEPLKLLDEYDTFVIGKMCHPDMLLYVDQMAERKKRVIWDVCDPMWWLNPKGADAMLAMVDAVVCSNDGLADDLYDVTGYRADVVIEDRMDREYHPTTKEHIERDAPVLLWYGAAQNRVPSIYGASLGLENIAARGTRYKLRFLDSEPGNRVNLPWCDVEHHTWRLDTFHEELLDADVALCPVHTGPWGRMKSNNKHVTAWWAGLPVVTLDDYADCDYAVSVLGDATMRISEGRANRIHAEQMYDVRTSVDEWEVLLCNL